MFEERKLENYKRQIKELSETNKAQKEEIKTLNQRLENMKAAVQEADKYIDIMQQEKIILAQAKDKYDMGYKELMRIKDAYKSKVEELIKDFKK